MSTINIETVVNPNAKPEREGYAIAIRDSQSVCVGISMAVTCGKNLQAAINKCRKMNREIGVNRYTVNGIAYA